ncbi:restriction endonuclease subunit S [Bacillus sp. JJ1566]|uniref:restriction endonuclease subunit S n=1 Tax=Bacillus sp. JJ1566 TaxID=3122961 RepID=UPI002FFE1C79
MSKKVKKMPVEELLEEALVPEEEHPYEVPRNWVYFNFTSILDVQGGTQPPKSEFIDEEQEGYVRLVQIRDFASDKYMTFIPDTPKLRKIEEEDILIARYGASIGKILTGLSGAYNVALAKVVFPNGKIYPKYLFWLLKSGHFQIPLMGLSRSAQSGFNKKDLSYFKMPLPPYKEQIRIANKVERLLNKIDEAKQLIDNAKEMFELRRASILNKAFCGELTAKWREDNKSTDVNFLIRKLNKKEGSIQIRSNKNDEKNAIPYKLPDGWKWIRLRDIATFKSGYAFKSNDFVDEGYQLIRMGNLYKNKLDLGRNPVFLPKTYDQEIVSRYSVEPGEILLTLTGTKYKRDYGYAIKVQNQDRKLLLNQRILALKPYELSDYFYYYLQSNTFRDMFFSFETGGVNQGNVGSTAVESIYFPLPPLEEGIEIQKKIETLLEKERASNDLLDIEEDIESMTQSILSKAFRGELGTNDPTEESAIELLKDALQD